MKSVLLITATMINAGAACATFSIPDFQQGDAWTYKISTNANGKESKPAFQEYKTIGKNATGNPMFGQRNPGNQIWSPSLDSKASCFLFLVNQNESFGEYFCNKEMRPGESYSSQHNWLDRVTTYVGQHSLPALDGVMETSHFLIEETLRGEDKIE